jgi:hypothetical protein
MSGGIFVSTWGRTASADNVALCDVVKDATVGEFVHRVELQAAAPEPVAPNSLARDIPSRVPQGFTGHER